MNQNSKLNSLIECELQYFKPNEIREAFLRVCVEAYKIVESWGYSDELHPCWIIANDEKFQLVYCSTGFGPSFSWGHQLRGATDLGMDSCWDAYLFEAFINSGMWTGETPEGFMSAILGFL